MDRTNNSMFQGIGVTCEMEVTRRGICNKLPKLQ